MSENGFLKIAKAENIEIKGDFIITVLKGGKIEMPMQNFKEDLKKKK